MEAQDESRGSWSHRAAFLSAAIGSAVGLGNIWRFPNYSYTYGGGAFFVPYLLSMCFIGVPILTLELAVGQIFRSGDIVAFGAMHKRLRGIGLGSIWCGFMVVCYYVVIIAWAMTMFCNCFRGDGQFPWASDSVAFFLDNVVGNASGFAADGTSLNRSMKLVPRTVFGVMLTWICIFLCTFRGAKVTGRITYITMLLPFVLIVFLAFFFGFLEGADEGVKLYVGKWDLEQLSKSTGCPNDSSTTPCFTAWPKAVGQTFFSVGVTFGIMTAYASYNKPRQGVQTDALIIAAGDTLAAIVGGFMVFAGLGVYARTQNAPAEDFVQGKSGGLGLVFFTVPAALQSLGEEPFNMSMEGRRTLAVIFFATVILLGIDSAFSLCEGFTTCMKDSQLLRGVPHTALVGLICLVGFSISLGYCNDTGLTALDTVDYYINVSMLFVGFMECVSAGWIYGLQEQRRRLGDKACATMFAAMVFACVLSPRVGLGFGTFSDDAWHGTLAGVLIFPIMFLAGMAIAWRLAAEHQRDRGFNSNGSRGALAHDLLLGNVEELRNRINQTAGHGAGNLRIPVLWSVLIKFVIPPVLMFMLQLEFVSPSYGDYEGYHAWFQGWGIFVAFAPWAAFAVGLGFPELYDRLVPQEESALSSSKVEKTGVEAAVEINL